MKIVITAVMSMSMFNLIHFSDTYSKTYGSLWQYYKDDPNDNVTYSK